MGPEHRGPGWDYPTPASHLVSVTCVGPRLPDLANKNSGCVLTSAAHILKLERYRED